MAGGWQGRRNRGASALVPGAAESWTRGRASKEGGSRRGVAESVALYTESNAVLALEVITMGVYLLVAVVEVILRL